MPPAISAAKSIANAFSLRRIAQQSTACTQYENKTSYPLWHLKTTTQVRGSRRSQHHCRIRKSYAHRSGPWKLCVGDMSECCGRWPADLRPGESNAARAGGSVPHSLVGPFASDSVGGTDRAGAGGNHSVQARHWPGCTEETWDRDRERERDASRTSSPSGLPGWPTPAGADGPTPATCTYDGGGGFNNSRTPSMTL